MMNQSNGNGTHPRSVENSTTDTSFLPSSPPHSDLNIAVVGMACKLPGADSLEEYWNILETGDVRCRDIPSNRFPQWRFERRQGVKNFKGNVIDDVDAFDHKFFKVASHEAKYMDPQQRLALQVVYQALESAGYFEKEPRDREQDTGCYFATCANEYHEQNVNSNPLSAFSLTGSVRPFTAGKVSHHFGWTGPSIMFDAACAGSAAAIHHACRALAFGDCTTAVAGATNLFISPDAFQTLAAGNFINLTGPSKSFDATADGYCRGEGIAFVVLKKLSAALRDGDVIRGVIASTAVGQNINERSITIPHAPSQMSLYRKALRLAGLDAQDITYVEGHATGTPVGDPIELESIWGVFGNTSQLCHDKKTYLGSVKSNIGHTEGTSGVAALIKVLLMLQKETIPQQAVFKSLNPAIASSEPPNMEISTKNIPWTSGPRNACVNNYGASGTNAVMVVTPPPDIASSSPPSLVVTYPISISAFSPSSLKSYCSALLDYINRSVEDDMIKDVAYHLSRRKNLELCHSVSTTVSSLQELKDVLTSTIAKPSFENQIRQRPMVLVFSGQTGNSVSISRVVYDSFAVVRKHLDDCDAVLQGLGAPSIFPAVFESEPQSDVVLSHSILFSAQYANAMAWIDCGLQPARLIGHSFGQLTALCVSGILSLRDSLQLVTSRANLIKRLWGNDSGAMIAITADLDRVTRLLSKHSDLNLEIACFNGPQNFVLTGHTPAVEALQSILESSTEMLRWKRLRVTHAYHSALTEPLVKPLRKIVQRFAFHKAKIPLETCTKDRVWDLSAPELVATHVRDPVYFYQALVRISEQLGPCTWLETGSTAGTAMLQRALEPLSSSHDVTSVDLGSTSSPDLLAKATSELWKQGIKVQFWSFHRAHQHQFRLLNLPPYQFDRSRHWLDYIELGASQAMLQAPSQQEMPLVRPTTQTTQTGGEFLINTKHEDWWTICSGYQIKGTEICPTSLLLDVAFQAINFVSDTTRNADDYDIRNLKLQSVMAASFDEELKLTITKCSSSSSWEFVIGDVSDTKLEYASGTIVLHSQSLREDFARFRRLVNVASIKDVSDDVDADSVRGKAVWRISSDFSCIPKPRQTINQLSFKGDEAVGYVRSTATTPFVAIEDFIRVPLLCLNGLLDRPIDRIDLPTRVGQMQYRKCTGSVSGKEDAWAVYVKFFELGGSETICDVFVFDVRSGQLFTIILDLVFSGTRFDSFQEGLGASIVLPRQIASSNQSHRRLPAQVELPTIQKVDLEISSHNLSIVQSIKLPDLTQTLFDLFVRVADVAPDVLNTDVTIADFGIDSLMQMEIAEEIKNVFSVKFKMEELALVPDMGSLCEMIAQRVTGFSYNPTSGSRTPSADSAVSILPPASSRTESSQGDEEYAMLKHRVSLPCLLNEPSNPVLNAFDFVRDKFDEFAIVTGCDKFLSDVYPLQTELVVAHTIEAFAKLGCDLYLVQPAKEIPSIPHVLKYNRLVARLMHALHEADLVAYGTNGWLRTSKKIPSTLSSTRIFEKLLAEHPDFATEHKLVHMVGCKLDECLTGKVSPISLLFGNPEKRQMMADQYTIAPMQNSATQQLATFIKQSFCSRGRRETLRVLEIGAGTCGTAIQAVSTFTQLDIDVEYTFSDISPTFVTAARSKLREFDFVKYRTLDITEDPTPDLSGSFDMIIATNVFHATPNVCKTSSNARQMLRPGGFMTLVEYTQPLYTSDLIYGPLDGWSVFDDGRDHAIMDEHGWNVTLRQAGFDHVDWTEGRTKESRLQRIILAY